MKYERFEDLPVWKAAMDVASLTYALTRDRYFSQPGDLLSQLRRAALSISNNIAEGFERGSTAELLTFLYIARGSAGEVRSMLHFVERDASAEHLKSEISNLKLITENCAKQIRGWADHLQNSDIKGQRHLTERSRQAFDRANNAAAFVKQIDEMVARARKAREGGE
ncbi:MAG: four helix bundle protein [Candidatus Hydrogenedentes bacterium]|nr:four helix bundle protein [Candidatus Hydrogenedentota bacterium]